MNGVTNPLNLIRLLTFSLLVVLSLHLPKVLAADKVFPPGSVIINMGVLPQTAANGLKPYGLIYELAVNQQIPVDWSISPTKAQDGIDFTVDGVNYRGGSFIIAADFVAEASAILSTWQAKGVVISSPTSSSFTAPIISSITSFPNAVLDLDRGTLVVPYYESAEIPSSSYRMGLPSDLNSCDDFYAMPHADPAWATHQNLLPFIENGGHLWAACHAVSVLESLENPVDPTENFHFLSNDGLIIFGGHEAGTLPYSQAIPNSPMAQYMGKIDLATENGSEQIYLPVPGSGWRSTTNIGVWDPDHPDVPANSPGKAVKLAWGRAFGDSNAGMVMYEGGHSHAKGTADDVNAQRVYFSSLLHAGVEKRPNIEMITAELPSDIDEGDAISLGVTVTEGSGLYTYQWKSTCGGTFSNPNGATTTFTAPETNVDMPCTIRGVVSDVCGRTSYYAKGAIIHPVFLSDLQITKTDNADPVGTGETINYTLTVVNAGPDTAPNVVVTDDLTATNTTFVSASGSGWSCNNNSGVVSCTVASLPVGTSTINLAVTAPVFATTVNNTASVSSDATEVDPANNSATESTGVKARVDLAINKFIGPKPEVLAGEDYSYFMNVDNVNGAEASTEIIMTDVLPVGAEYVSASGIGWSCGYDISTRTVICTLPGGLASGATADIIELVVTSTEGGDYVNTASVDAPESFDTNSANNSDSATRTVAAVTALEINKLINNANPVDNEAIVFTLLLTNNGPSTATDIRVTDPVPLYVASVQSGFDGVSSPDNGITTPNGGSVALTQTNNVLQWDITQLDVGETVALTIDATYQRATFLLGGTVDDGLVENVATIFEFGSYGVPQVVDPDLFDNLDTASVGSPEADVGVSKIATKDATVPSPISVSELDRNDSFSYVIDVVNNGSSDLSIRLAGTLQTDLQVVDTLPEEVTFVDLTNTDAAWSCLTAGVPVTVTCDYRPSADETFANGSSLPPIVINAIAPADTGDLTNQVAVKYTNSEVNERVDNNSVNDSFTLVTPVTAPQVDLALSKVVDNATPAIGETVTYTITVDNTTGPDDATGLQISDTLPVGVTQLTATANVGSYNGGVWAIGDLPFGSSANLIITAKVDNPEQITNTAEITAFNEVDPTPESPKSAVIDVPDADLQLTKVVSAAPVAPNSAPLTVGQSVEFTITLENNGSVDGLGSQVATNVVVTDVLPNGLTIVDAGTDITTSVGTATLDASGSVITWNIPAIAVGAGNKQAMVIVARVDSNATLVNNASVTASDLHDAITANNSDSATVDVIEADLNVTKTFVNDRVVYPGDTAEFTIEVTNNGPDTATGVQLLDTMTPGLSVTVPATDISVTSGSFIYNASAGTIDWTVGTVAIGVTQTMTVKANVSQTGTLRNNAEISASDQSDANPNNNYDAVTVLSGGNADLFLTKQIDDPSVTIGDTVTFTLEIVNNGPDSATNIVVQDIMPSDLSNISGTPSSGLFNSTTGIWDSFSLLNGETATLVITAQVDASGQYSNVGLILGSDQGDPDATSDIAKSLYEVFPAGTLNQLSGFVYYDANDNGSHDAEGAVNQNTYVKLVSDLDPDYAVEIASVDPTTGAYSFDGVPDGSYQLVVDDNNFSSDVTANAPNAWAFRTPSNGLNTITVAGADISNIDFGLLPDIQYGVLAGQVIINEVLTRTKNGNDQFIEISNVSGGPISLAGWQLVDGNIYVDDIDGGDSLTGDANNPSYIFPSGASLANGEYAVIWLGPNSGDTQAPAAGFQDWMDVNDNLNRDGDELWLINSSLGLIDYIAWGAGNDLNTPPPASLNAWNTVTQAELDGVGKGQSLSLTRDSLDGNTSACWEMTTSDDASGRCSAFLPTIIGDDDAAAGRTSSAGLNNNGVTFVPATIGVIVSGYLYSDANHNGQFNTDETGTADSTLVLFNLVDNTCISVMTNNEGYYEFTSVENGDYQIISADGEALPTPATCPVAESDPSGTVSTTTNTREVTVAGVTIPNQNFGDYNGSIVRGNVFVDNGAGAGTAYNGILDGDEQASASVPIELLDGTSVLESVLTDASGGFELWVPSTYSNISIQAQTPSGYLSVTESVGNSGATVDTDRDVISFTALAGTTYTDLAFGDIATPAFAPDHKRSGIAGSFVVFPHTFTSEAPGDVSFSIINPVATPDMSGWSAILYLDEDCDGQLAASDPVINGSIQVDPDTNKQICTIAKVLIPAMADPNAQYLIEVKSDIAFTGADIANNTSVRSDLTTVGLASEAGLIIVKSVDKTSALPGETLVYTIIYRNTSREPLDNIVVYDSTPVFTHFLSASCITPLPTSISNCAVTKAPAVNGSGSVAWTMSGKLDPDTEGTVVYKVGVDN